jgi:hypothetical protein
MDMTRWLLLSGPLLGGLLGVWLGVALWRDSKTQVSGWVTYNGYPVGSGSVVMVGWDGLPVYGQIQPDGSYFIKKPRTGVVKVAVTSPAPVAPILAKSRVGDKFRASDNASASPPDNWFAIPARYGDPETSDLSLDVRTGRNSFDIELK